MGKNRHGENSNEAALKRERVSLRGKIERRKTAILFAESNIREYQVRLRIIEAQLKEYRPTREPSP